MRNKLTEIAKGTRTSLPLIHCLVGAVSASLCANGLLSIGARPIMSQHPKEVGEITALSGALLVNFAGITQERIRAIRCSLAMAKKGNIPVVLDAVGVACSRFRRSLAKKLLRKYRFVVIKGNYSEIYSLFDMNYTASGVDSKEIHCDDMVVCVKQLAKKYNAIILASGKADIVCDGKDCFLVKNGVPQLAKITGTGCLLGAITASCLATENSVYSVLTACAWLGIAGEKAAAGGDMFSARLLDSLTNTDFESLKIEEVLI